MLPDEQEKMNMSKVRHVAIGFGGIAENRVAEEGFACDKDRFGPLKTARLAGTLTNLGYEIYGDRAALRGYGTMFHLSGCEEKPIRIRLELDDGRSRGQVRHGTEHLSGGHREPRQERGVEEAPIRRGRNPQLGALRGRAQECAERRKDHLGRRLIGMEMSTVDLSKKNKE